MSDFRFVVEHLLNYVERKAKSFLEKHELGQDYEKIKESAVHQTTSSTDFLTYINNLLNETINVVSNKEKKEWNDIREEFNSFYLSNDE